MSKIILSPWSVHDQIKVWNHFLQSPFLSGPNVENTTEGHVFLRLRSSHRHEQRYGSWNLTVTWHILLSQIYTSHKLNSIILHWCYWLHGHWSHQAWSKSKMVKCSVKTRTFAFTIKFLPQWHAVHFITVERRHLQILCHNKISRSCLYLGCSICFWQVQSNFTNPLTQDIVPLSFHFSQSFSRRRFPAKTRCFLSFACSGF